MSRGRAQGPPRSLHIALVEFAPSGGLFQFATQLGEGLARHGHRVRLLTGPQPELESREPGFAVVSALPTWHPGATAVEAQLKRRLRRVWRAVLHVTAWVRLLTMLRRMRPDAVLWSAWRFPVDGWFVRLADRLLPHAALGIVAHEPRPLVEQSGAEPMYKNDRVLAHALAGAYACMDVIFTLGDEARTTLRQTWRPRAPIVVVPHGNESVFAREDVRPVEHTEPQVLFFGTWTRYKGIEVLLDAFARVRQGMPEARLVMAGAVSADVDLSDVRRRAAAVGGVTLRPGYVALDDVARYFGDARVVVLPYTRASQSGVAHLAMTLGRPVVATRVGDIPTAVPDGAAGWLVEPGDAAALAGALLVPLRDPGQAAAAGRRGAERMQAEGSWDAVASKVGDALLAAASRGG